MAVTFEQISTSNLYQVAASTAGAWCAYMLGPNDSNPNLPITLDEAFSTYTGSFLFAPTIPVFGTATEANAFIADVQNWLTPSGGSFFGRFCVWIPRAGTSPVFATASFSGAGTNYAWQFSQQGGGYSLQTSFNSLVGLNMWLSVASGVFLSVQGDGLGLYGPQQPGIAYQSPNALQLTVPSARAVIPLSGASAGCIVVAGTLTISSQLGGFVIGMQYAYGNGSGTGPADVVQPFPVLDTTGTPSFGYVGAFDPIDPFCTGAASDPAAGIYRTILTVSGGTVSLPSHYRTVTNQPIALLPQATGDATAGPAAYDGGFIFQPATPIVFGANLQPAQTTVYLAPAGDYQIGVAATTSPIELLCGLAGTETIQLQPPGGLQAPDAIRFVGVCTAYTPRFPLPQADLASPSSGIATPPLPPASKPTYLTSWAEIMPGAGHTPTYSAQPQGNALFGPQGAYGNGSNVAGALRPSTQIGPTTFPIVPWAGVGTASPIPVGQWGDYESKVLSTARRNAIQAYARPKVSATKALRASMRAAGPTAAPGPIVANGTTPQGLLAQLDSTSGHTIYDAVVLAQSDDLDTPTSQMAFYDLNAALQGLFQTNQLFAVITNPANLGTFANTVDIAGWKMQADVGAASGSSNVSNVLILKFCVGALVDLVAKPSAWVDPADFSSPDPNTGVAVLSQALQTYIAGAVANAAGGNALYRKFAEIVSNPDWQGVLVLGAEISPSDLPPQLAGLAAGITFSNFRAHHFGVTVSPVVYNGTTLSIPGSSSFFGLVDYQLPAYARNLLAGASPTQPLALPVSGPYGFTVLQLQSLFDNSALVDFKSHVQVTLNQMFGSPVTASYANATRLAANSVVLTGYYQNQGGTGTYLFESDTPTVMLPDSNVLDAVVLTKLIFNTLTNDDNGTPPSILSRILIWGSFDFSVLANTTNSLFDLMSYGMPDMSQPQNASGGLAFSNLHLDMSSPVATPNATSYQIVETNLSFDQAASVLRPGSVVSGLALQPQSFIVAPAGTTPASQGFLPVILDQGAPPQTAITQAWYGISCLINMGGPGALASAAGFTSTLLLAWSPQTNRAAKAYAAFAGLQLPGASPGASAFSLQGVINLTVGNISLSYAPVQGGGGDAFTLRLSNISLSFLGLAKLPSSASIDLFLFGDPGGTGSLGWYAAYVETKPQKTPPLTDGRAAA
jgi:hypothetical protein